MEGHAEPDRKRRIALGILWCSHTKRPIALQFLTLTSFMAYVLGPDRAMFCLYRRLAVLSIPLRMSEKSSAL